MLFGVICNALHYKSAEHPEAGGECPPSVFLPKVNVMKKCVTTQCNGEESPQISPHGLPRVTLLEFFLYFVC